MHALLLVTDTIPDTIHQIFHFVLVKGIFHNVSSSKKNDYAGK